MRSHRPQLSRQFPGLPIVPTMKGALFSHSPPSAQPWQALFSSLQPARWGGRSRGSNKTLGSEPVGSIEAWPNQQRQPQISKNAVGRGARSPGGVGGGGGTNVVCFTATACSPPIA